MYQDDDEDKDNILKMLGGEVDDFAGSQLPEQAGGVTIEIHVKPHGEPDGDEPEEKEPSMEAENGEHDPIAHILGMCGGGCAG